MVGHPPEAHTQRCDGARITWKLKASAICTMFTRTYGLKYCTSALLWICSYNDSTWSCK